MTVLDSTTDFKRCNDLSNFEVGDKVLIKSSAASGWASVAKVTRIMLSQIEVQTINIIPTKDHHRWGTTNPFVDDREKGDFFLRWNDAKRCNVGRKSKFFIKGGLKVGFSTGWNPKCIAQIVK